MEGYHLSVHNDIPQHAMKTSNDMKATPTERRNASSLGRTAAMMIIMIMTRTSKASV